MLIPAASVDLELAVEVGGDFEVQGLEGTRLGFLQVADSQLHSGRRAFA